MPSLEYNNLKYITEIPLNFDSGMRIEYKEQIPASLYKYYSQQNYNLDSLAKGELYFSHPFRFNDITDTNPLSINFSGLVFEVYCQLYEDSNLKEDELRSNYEKDKLKNFHDYKVLLHSLWTQKIGICCFSTNEMHDLMWGHYSSDSGFKIKFNSENLITSLERNNENPLKIFPINYVKRKLQVSVLKYGIGIPLLLDFSTKVQSWSYEKEWRVIMAKNDMDIPYQIKTPNIPKHEGNDSRLFKFDTDSISEIVLGMDFFNGNNLEHSKYVSNSARIIKVNNNSLCQFLNFIVKNLSGRIYQAGIYVAHEMQSEGVNVIGRSIEQIEIKKVDDFRFKVERNNLESLRKF